MPCKHSLRGVLEKADAVGISIDAPVRQLQEKREQANTWLRELREGEVEASTVAEAVEFIWLPPIQELLRHRFPDLLRQFEDETTEPLTSPQSDRERVFDSLQRRVRRLDGVLVELGKLQQLFATHRPSRD